MDICTNSKSEPHSAEGRKEFLKGYVGVWGFRIAPSFRSHYWVTLNFNSIEFSAPKCDVASENTIKTSVPWMPDINSRFCPARKNKA